ncbi:MAG: Bug family tripartite tricarboxylate transporter substrate binding protein [Burkholderiales bacterium]
MKILLAFLALCAAAPVAAQDWPNRPVVVVMPYRPGGGGESMVRLVMARVGQDLGQQVLIENRPGAGGTIGAAYVAKAKPDGYILLASGLGSSVVAPAMEVVPFDAMKDFTHIALFGGPPPVLAVHAAFPAKTLREYVTIARASKEGIAYGSSGHGTHVHLLGELFKIRAGANMIHVPYNGGGPAAADLMAGHVPSALVTLGSTSQHMRAGKVRALAVATTKRVPDMPDLPTFAELGFKEMTGATWFSLSGPAGLPRHIAIKLNAVVRAAMVHPEVRGKLAAEAIEPGDLDPDTFTEFFRTEIARWTPIARGLPKESNAGSLNPAGRRE